MDESYTPTERSVVINRSRTDPGGLLQFTVFGGPQQKGETLRYFEVPDGAVTLQLESNGTQWVVGHVIQWATDSSLAEPRNSRVTVNLTEALAEGEYGLEICFEKRYGFPGGNEQLGIEYLHNEFSI